MEDFYGSLEEFYDLEGQSDRGNRMRNVNKVEEYNEEGYVEVVKNVRLARAYVPYQKLEKLYSPKESLKKGTIFPELDQPEF